MGICTTYNANLLLNIGPLGEELSILMM